MPKGTDAPVPAESPSDVRRPEAPSARSSVSRDNPTIARSEEAPATLPRDPVCPFCSGHETELMNAFGSQLSVATYWCRACGSPFELMKWRSGA